MIVKYEPFISALRVDCSATKADLFLHNHIFFMYDVWYSYKRLLIFAYVEIWIASVLVVEGLESRVNNKGRNLSAANNCWQFQPIWAN